MSQNMIEQTWTGLQERMRCATVSEGSAEVVKTAFTAGLYAAASAIANNRFDARSISEAAHRIEHS